VGYGETYGLMVLGIPIILLSIIWLIALAVRGQLKWPGLRQPLIALGIGLALSFIGKAVPLPATYRDPIVFGVLILVLLVKPTGLLGASEREKV